MSLVSDAIDNLVNGVKAQTQPIGAKVEGKFNEHVGSNPTYQKAEHIAGRAKADVKEYADTTSRGVRMVQQGSEKVLNDEARERIGRGNIEQTKPMNREVRQPATRPATVSPIFGRPRKQTANIYRYGGVGSGGGGSPNFGIGQNPVNFSNGGSTVNTAHLHGFGRMQEGGMFGSLSGLSGKTFGMNDGKLNFTRATFEKNRKKKKD